MIPPGKRRMNRDCGEWESGGSFLSEASLDSACRCFYFSHCPISQKISKRLTLSTTLWCDIFSATGWRDSA
jgi:hypothetical protein